VFEVSGSHGGADPIQYSGTELSRSGLQFNSHNYLPRNFRAGMPPGRQ